MYISQIVIYINRCDKVKGKKITTLFLFLFMLIMFIPMNIVNTAYWVSGFENKLNLTFEYVRNMWLRKTSSAMLDNFLSAVLFLLYLTRCLYQFYKRCSSSYAEFVFLNSLLRIQRLRSRLQHIQILCKTHIFWYPRLKYLPNNIYKILVFIWH